MASLNLTELEQVRLKAYQNMTAAGRKVADDFLRRQSNIAALDLLTRYDTGVQLNEVAAQPDKYGADAMQQLADFTGRSASELYGFRNFAAKFSRPLVEQAAARHSSDGTFLTYRHFIVLASLKSESERNDRLAKMFSNPLSARELDRELKALGVEKTKRSRGGRKRVVRPPSSPLLAFREIYCEAYTVNHHFDVWTDIFDTIDECSPGDIDVRHATKIRQAIGEVGSMLANAKTVHDRLSSALERCQDMLAAQQPDAVVASVGDGGARGDAGNSEIEPDDDDFDGEPEIDDDFDYEEDRDDFEPPGFEYDGEAFAEGELWDPEESDGQS